MYSIPEVAKLSCNYALLS